MKVPKLFFPFVIILIVCGQALNLIGLICGAQLESYNQNLEGARILLYRRGLADSTSLKKIDILFAGTSRTMADYDPEIFAETLAKNIPLPSTPTGRNLGNLANYPDTFESYLNSGQVHPKLLIIEFSPHMFVLPDEVAEKSDLYSKYRLNTRIQELFIDGWIRKMLGLDDLGWLSPSALLSLTNTRSARRLTCGGKLDVIRLNAYGYGQRLKEGGQVPYHVYLPDRQAAESMRQFASTEYAEYKNVYLVGSFKDPEWEAYKRIIRSVQSHGSVVVVRPAVDPALYALENQQLPSVIGTVTQYLASNEIPYVDMNPNDYSALDTSHIDWYDTPKLSQDLALKIIPLVDWDKFLKR